MVRGRLLALGVFLAIGASAGSASAATITVNTFFDDQQAGDGQCSLRKAVQDVNSPGSAQTDCAPAAFGANTIVLAPSPQRYQLGGSFPQGAGPLVIAANVKNLTVAGAGSSSTVIDAGALANRVFQVVSGAGVTLVNLGIVNGGAPGGAAGSPGGAGQPGSNGGAILNQGTLTLNGVAITNSRAGSGGTGGGASSGPGGDGGAGGSGGAIYSTGSLTLNGATIGNNSAGSGGGGGAGAQATTGTAGGNGGPGGTGGGIENAGGTLTVIASTIRGNSAADGGLGGTGGTGNSGAGGIGGNGAAGANGGGIWSDGGSLSITNSTFASNSAGAGGTGGSGGAGSPTGANGGAGGAGGNGGALGAATPSSATLLQVTTAGNNAGSGGSGGSAGTGGTAGAPGASGSAGGVLGQGSSITLRNSLLALNNGGNCSGSVLDGGFNLSFGDPTCPATFASGDPNLGPLQGNGGPAPTISLQPGSAAINQIPPSGANCPATDERGVPRPARSSASKCDIGAYEVTGPAASTGAATNVSLNTATLTASVTPNAGAAAIVFQYGTTTKYGKTTPVQKVGAVTATPVTAKLGGLRSNTTYHYRVVVVAMDGNATGADRTFTTSVTPSITRLSVSPKSFKAPVGTTVAYSDSKAATTTLTALRCVKTVHGRCTRYTKLASFTRKDTAGQNTVKVKGRFGNRALLKGGYKLELTPRASGKTGKTATTTFRIL